MKMGSVTLQGRTVLAPMAGITDSCFRLLCKEQGAALVFTEMVSADGIIRDDKKSLDYLLFQPTERPIAAQIFGSQPEVMAEAAKHVESFAPDFIDLNFGCPVKKVVKKGAGAAILKDLKLLRKITNAVIRATSLPVMAKIRSGWTESQVNAVEAVKILEDCGVCAVTIHPRSQDQFFKKHANWEIIRQVKQAVSIPVIGNGDIKNPVDAKKMLMETGCDLIMIGRAALGNPWIFRQIDDYLNKGTFEENVPVDHRLKTSLNHLKFTIQQKGEYRGVREMRKHLAWYIRGLPHSTNFKANIFKFKSHNQARDELIGYFNEVKEVYDCAVSTKF